MTRNFRVAPQSKRRRIRNRPEQALQCHVADALRWLRPACIWFAVPNEGRRGYVAAAMLKRMGLRPGVSDLIFLWDEGSGAIEMKAPGEVQNDNQKDFEADCRRMGVPYEVCWSLDHVIDVLVRWGRLPPDTIQRLRGITWEPKVVVGGMVLPWTPPADLQTKK